MHTKSLLSLVPVLSALVASGSASSVHQRRAPVANHDAIVKRLGEDAGHQNGRNLVEESRSDNGTTLEKRFSNARMTWFVTGQGNCGGFNQPSDFIVALNSPQYAGGANCGKSITIHYQGRTATATVADQCMGCAFGAIDLTEGLFQFLVSPRSAAEVGTIYAEWNFGSGGGGGQDDHPKPDPPKPTTTKKPPPKTTSTPPPEPTTTSSSSSSSRASSSAASRSSSASAARSSSAPAVTPSGAQVVSQVNQAVLGLGEMLAAALN